MEGMFEVEVKCPVRRTSDPALIDTSVASICRKLEIAGAVSRGRWSQSDLYLDHPCRDLGRTDESVRIRSEVKAGVGRTKLTYKGPKVSERSKARKELEIELSAGTEPSTVGSFFKALGFDEVIAVRKERTVYDLSGVELSVDAVEGLGVFIEAEKVSTSVAEAETEIIALMDSLGFHERERRSYLELILEG